MKTPSVQNPESGNQENTPKGDTSQPENPIDQGPKHSNGQTTAQLLSHLGKHYKPTPATAKEDFLTLMLSNPPISATKAVEALGLSWETVNTWRREDEAWASRYALARETVADYHADRSLTVLDDTQSLILNSNPQLGSSLASVGREKSQGHRWYAAVTDRKRYSDKEIAGTVGPVNVVIALPALQQLPSPPATTRIVDAQVVESHILSSGGDTEATG